MPLTTRCHHCGRLFPVYAQQLKERRGKVDCPQCGKRFAAIGGLQDELLPGIEVSPDISAVGGSYRPPAPADMLDLSEGRRKTGRVRAALWSIGILLLVAGLAVQVGWWDRGNWMRHPQVRAALEAACNTLDCRLDPPWIPGTMEIHQPTLTERPEDSGGLRLTLTLRNKSTVFQRLPQLQLELYDAQGTLAAARRFDPHHYLADASSRHALASGAAIRPLIDLQPPPIPTASFRVTLY